MSSVRNVFEESETFVRYDMISECSMFDGVHEARKLNRMRKKIYSSVFDYSSHPSLAFQGSLESCWFELNFFSTMYRHRKSLTLIKNIMIFVQRRNIQTWKQMERSVGNNSIWSNRETMSFTQWSVMVIDNIYKSHDQMSFIHLRTLKVIQDVIEKFSTDNLSTFVIVGFNTLQMD